MSKQSKPANSLLENHEKTGAVSGVSTFSTNPNREGRVLIIAIGGAGIPQVYKNVNDNLRLALEKVPYLSDNAEKIDYLALFRKDSADLTVEDVANIARTIYRHHTPISD